MRVLITGSRGFVGRHVQNNLRAAGHETLDLITAAERPARNAHEYEGDICDANRMRSLVRDLRPTPACISPAWPLCPWRGPSPNSFSRSTCRARSTCSTPSATKRPMRASSMVSSSAGLRPAGQPPPPDRGRPDEPGQPLRGVQAGGRPDRPALHPPLRHGGHDCAPVQPHRPRPVGGLRGARLRPPGKRNRLRPQRTAYARGQPGEHARVSRRA
jgi:hypothetical protein